MNLIGRRHFVETLGLLTAAGLGWAGTGKPEAAPRFTAKSMDGQSFSNDSISGKIVLLDFWTSWCPFCRNEASLVDRLAAEYKDKGLMVLAVNVGETKKKVRKYLEDAPRSCPVILTDDTNLAAMYAATVYPIYVLIDKDGTVAGEQRGAGGEPALRHLLSKAGLE